MICWKLSFTCTLPLFISLSRLTCLCLCLLGSPQFPQTLLPPLLPMVWWASWGLCLFICHLVQPTNQLSTLSPQNQAFIASPCFSSQQTTWWILDCPFFCVQFTAISHFPCWSCSFRLPPMVQTIDPMQWSSALVMLLLFFCTRCKGASVVAK